MKTAPISPVTQYRGRTAALATKHDKGRFLEGPFLAELGLTLKVPEDLDTDLLGTFTGEIARKTSPKQTAIKKARLGMRSLGLPLGLATEGSFGPHPLIECIPVTEEIIVFIDDQIDIQITESIVSAETNYSHLPVMAVSELGNFLEKARFPSHALIVRPNEADRSFRLRQAASYFFGKRIQNSVFKGITDRGFLAEAIDICKDVSSDGKAHVETDMRAHMNPTRQRLLSKLATKLARRLRTACPDCACPGWGITDFLVGLPCAACGYPTDAFRFEIHSCAKCNRKQKLARADGVTQCEPAYCPRCNP